MSFKFLNIVKIPCRTKNATNDVYVTVNDATNIQHANKVFSKFSVAFFKINPNRPADTMNSDPTIVIENAKYALFFQMAVEFVEGKRQSQIST